MALPWANPVDTEVQEVTPSNGSSERLPASLGATLAEAELQEQDEIQVRWTLEHEDEEGNSHKQYVWWDATVVGPAEVEGVQGPAFELLYAPRDSFAAEKAVVTFSRRAHLLNALDQEGFPQLFWRKKDESWEPGQGDSEAEEAEEEAGDDDAAAGDEDENEDDIALHLGAHGIQPDKNGNYGVEAVLEVLGCGRNQSDKASRDQDPEEALDAFQQRVVADGMRHFVEMMKEMVKDAPPNEDGQVVVTEGMVKDALEKAQIKRRRLG